jgi:hypothetical protein
MQCFVILPASTLQILTDFLSSSRAMWRIGTGDPVSGRIPRPYPPPESPARNSAPSWREDCAWAGPRRDRARLTAAAGYRQAASPVASMAALSLGGGGGAAQASLSEFGGRTQRARHVTRRARA